MQYTALTIANLFMKLFKCLTVLLTIQKQLLDSECVKPEIKYDLSEQTTTNNMTTGTPNVTFGDNNPK